MKMAIYHGPKNIEIKEAPIPECGENDVLIRNMYASICGSDVFAYANDGSAVHIWPEHEFGHEMVSRVEKVGDKVTDFKVGDIVYPYPMVARGRENSATLGGFSEYILVKDAKIGQHLYKVDPAIDPKVASMIEPFTVGTRAARRAEPKQGESAIVFGAGAIGASAAIALKYFGCDKVMVVDFSDFRLNVLKNMGFYVCNPKTEDLKAKMIETFGKSFGLGGETANVDIWIDAVGAKSVLDNYQAMAKVFNRMVIVGVHHEPRPVNLMLITYGQGALIGSGGYMPEDVYDVMKIMASGEYDLASMITGVFDQDDICKAIETATDSEHSFKCIIDYHVK